MKRIVSLDVNGRTVEDVVPDNLLLMDFLRDRQGSDRNQEGLRWR